MKKIFIQIFITFLFTNVLIDAQTKIVYVGNINGEITLTMAAYVKRVISEAEKANADAIIFRINTFGGRVDAATQIKDAIVSSNILTIAFVDHQAISAGSYITLACKKIAMAPGSSIGAATVVDQSGNKMSEKYQSFMRSEMRAVAERNGRRVDIAQGMVDEKISIPGLVDSTQLVTLTTDEARKYGIADTVVSSLHDVLNAFALKDAEVVKLNPNWAEEFVGFIRNPIVTALLLMIGFVGIFLEVKSPGWTLPGTFGVLALVLFFGSSYILDLASNLEIIMFVAGIILLFLEIFVIPGFGVAGILGIILIIASMFSALLGNMPVFDFTDISEAIIQLTASLVGSIILVFIIVKYLPKSSRFSKMVLSEEEKSDDGFTSRPSKKNLIGEVGIALTTLRPAGTAIFNGEKVDVVTDGEYLENGSKIKVIRVEGIRVVVQKVNENE